MTSTTIKVSMETRDRLKAQARAAHRTLDAHLDELADLADRRARLDSLADAVLRSPASVRESHLDEAEAWENTELTDAANS